MESSDLNIGVRVGRVVKLFGRDHKTIYDWVNRYEKFFSEAARHHRGKLFHPDDLIVINTIMTERMHGVEWTEIRVKLEAGYRDPNLPIEASGIEGERAIQLFLQLNVLRQKLEMAETEVERLREELVMERESKFKQAIQLAGDLNARIGKLEAENEMLRQQLQELKAT